MSPETGRQKTLTEVDPATDGGENYASATLQLSESVGIRPKLLRSYATAHRTGPSPEELIQWIQKVGDVEGPTEALRDRAREWLRAFEADRLGSEGGSQ